MVRKNKVSVWYSDDEIALIREAAGSDRPRAVAGMIRFMTVRRAMALRNMARAMESDPKILDLVRKVVENLSDADIQALS